MDYREMAAIVKERGDRILEEQRIRRMRIRRISAAVSSLCAVAAVSFCVLHSYQLKKVSPDNFNGNSNIISSETSVPVHSETTTAGTSSAETKTTTAVTASSVSNVSTAVTEKISSTIPAGTTAGTVTTINVTSVSPSETAGTIPVTTAYQSTAASVPVTTAVTTAAETEETVIRERSYYMKRISAAFTALLTASAIIPTPENNAVASGIITNPLNKLFYDCVGEWPCTDKFEEINQDESVLDVNKDGVFDALDVYIYHYLVDHGNYLKPHFSLDIDGNGKYDEELEQEAVMSYFMYYHEMKQEYFTKEYYTSRRNTYMYENDMNDSEKTAYDDERLGQYLKYFSFKADTYRCCYNIFKEKLQAKAIDLDTNGDGVFNAGDVFDLYSFRYAILPEDHIHHCNLPDDIYERCLAVNNAFDFGDASIEPENYALLYFLEKNEFRPEYLDEEYYSSFRQDDYYCYDEKLSYVLFNYSEEKGYYTNKLRDDVECRDIDSEYRKYLAKVKSGKLDEPDLDLDGVITIKDHIAADELFTNYRYKSSEIWTDELRENFLTNFDLNGNGISGDCIDCILAQTYIAEHIEKNVPIGVSDYNYISYEKFKFNWINNNVISWVNTTDKNCLDDTLYPLTDENDLFSLCPNYVYAFVYEDDANREMIINEYCTLVETGRLPEPDVDMNGVIDKNDYLAAAVTLFSQTHTNWNIDNLPSTEVMMNFINNYDLDNSGVSGDYMDSIMILEYISRKLDINSFNLEVESWKACGYVERYAKPVQVPTEPVFPDEPDKTWKAAPAYSLESDQISGDANCDGNLTFADSVAVMQAIANPDKYGIDGSAENHLTEAGKKCADIDSEPGLTLNDARAIIGWLTE